MKPSDQSLSPLLAYKLFWSRAFDFSGLSRRPEFWWPYLINTIIFATLWLAALAEAQSYIKDYDKIETIWNIINFFYFASLVPNLSITVRRLRDSGRKWPWLLIGVIPFGGIWLIILLAQPSIQAL